LREGLGADHAAMIVKEASYEVTDPTVDSQVITLQDSGADTLLILATPKAAAQTIRKSYDIGWRPERYMSYVSSFIAALKPAGLDVCKGLVTASWGKDPNDPRWIADPGFKEWTTFVAKYMTPAELSNAAASYGFTAAGLLVHVLKQCGNDLSRENIMHQATNIGDFESPMGLPGMKYNTSPDDYRGVRQLQLARFNGESWDLFGDLLGD
jgi:branched-chain amino acid transport system substrate-binding protein